MSHERNRGANKGGTGGKEDYEVGQGVTAKDSSKNKVDGSGRRKRTRIKQGMRGSCARASRHRLKTFNITSKGMKATELLDHLKQRKGNSDEMKREEMDELIKDSH